MTDRIMTWVLRIVCYGIQLGVPAAAAAGLARLLTGRSSRMFFVVFALLLLLFAGLLGYLAVHPILTIPEEYSAYISPEEEKTIVSLNRGVYSANIPIIAVHIEVISASDREITVRTWYLFWGVTEMSVSEDGPSITKPLA